MFISKEAEVICNSLKNNFESWEQYRPDPVSSSYFVATDPLLPQMIIVYASTNVYMVKSWNGEKVKNVSNLNLEQIELVRFNFWDTFRIQRNLSVQRMRKNARIEKGEKEKLKKIDLEVRERLNKIILELSMIPANEN